MPKALIINSVCATGSTGRIVRRIVSEYAARGWEVKIAHGRETHLPENCAKCSVRIGNKWSVVFHGLLTRLFDLHGTGPCSYFATRRFLKWAEGWKPDVVWLHNLHGYYLNYELLFRWLKRHPEIEVKWTLHDCWPFTGHCAYFDYKKCEKWKTCCNACPEKRTYPASVIFSRAKRNWMNKMAAFTGVKKLTLITPSEWLASLTRQSFLKEYPVEIVNNTIDTRVFRPTPNDFRFRYHLDGKIIVLGVASVWDRRKGLDDFLLLRRLLDSDIAKQPGFARIEIVLVGLTERQISALPRGVTGIIRTKNTAELVAIYSASDWFFNPTREDNYPTVNLEARACGCRVVTYDTGGSAETVEGYDKAWVLKGADKSPEGFVRLLENLESK